MRTYATPIELDLLLHARPCGRKSNMCTCHSSFIFLQLICVYSIGAKNVSICLLAASLQSLLYSIQNMYTRICTNGTDLLRSFYSLSACTVLTKAYFNQSVMDCIDDLQTNIAKSTLKRVSYSAKWDRVHAAPIVAVAVKMFTLFFFFSFRFALF